MTVPKIDIGGRSIPSGYLIGRVSPGTGRQELIALADLGRQMVSLNIVQPAGAPASLVPIADQRVLGNGSGGSAAPVALSITQPAAGLTVAWAVGGITLALANDLAAVEGLGTTGIATRTGAATWTTRTITGTADKITVTDGDGVAGNPTLTVSATYAGQNTIATVGTVTAGTWSATISGATLPDSGQISSAGWIGIGGTAAAKIHLLGDLSAAAWTTSGVLFRVNAATLTDTSSSGTVTNVTASNYGVPTFAASNAVTYTSASNVRIGGPPAAGANVTLTNPAALTVVSGRIVYGVSGISASNTFFTFYPQTAGQSIFHLWNGDSSNFNIGSGALGSEVAKLTIRSVTGNVGVGGQTLPASTLAVGTAAATFRVYNSFTDASNGEWAYGGDWSVANIAMFGPDKNGTGTYRVGRWVSGGNTIWESLTNGDFRMGTGTALATTATGGFPKVPTCAGAPTGVPANAATGSAEMIYDSTNKKLWIYDNATAAWLGVVLA